MNNRVPSEEPIGSHGQTSGSKHTSSSRQESLPDRTRRKAFRGPTEATPDSLVATLVLTAERHAHQFHSYQEMYDLTQKVMKSRPVATEDGTPQIEKDVGAAMDLTEYRKIVHELKEVTDRIHRMVEDLVRMLGFEGDG